VRTEVSCYRDGREYTWEGDAPLLVEGQLVSLPDVTRARVVTVCVHLGVEPWQSVICR
jgi:hypothetical protein